MTLIERLANRVQLMIGRAVIEAVKDSGGIQLVKIAGLADELQEDVEHVQAYGLAGNAPAGSEAVVVFCGGNREHGIAVVVGNGTNRPTDSEPGEVVLWSTFGKNIKLNKDGEIEIALPNGVEPTTDFAVAFDNLKSGFDTLVSNFNNHTHVITVAGATPSAPPTPVTAAAAPPAASTASIDSAKVAAVRLP